MTPDVRIEMVSDAFLQVGVLALKPENSLFINDDLNATMAIGGYGKAVYRRPAYQPVRGSGINQEIFKLLVSSAGSDVAATPVVALEAPGGPYCTSLSPQ